MKADYLSWSKNRQGSQLLPRQKQPQKLLDLWLERGIDFRDYMEWYINLDVVPFIKDVTRFKEFYKCKDLDMFNIAMPTPCLARTEFFHTAE